MKKMRAIVKREKGPGLSMEEVAVPRIGINDVLVRVLRSAVCGTDTHIYKWDDWAAATIPVPLVIGHEFAGTVAAIGSNVHDLEVGDLVSGEGHLVCGRCRNCLAGRRHLCHDSLGIGIQRPGAFADYISIPITNIWHADPGIPLEILSIFDPFGNAAHCALSFKTLGEDILITGAGPIGLMATAIARHAGARFIVVSDPNPFRRGLALKMGATLVFDPAGSQGLSDIQRSLGMKEGFDVGLEMSGNPGAFREMVDNMSHGGKIALLGLPSGDPSIDWRRIIFNMLTIKGIYGREMYETWYMMQSMLQTGLDITPVITHRFPADSFEEAFRTMISGECGKVILDWESG